MDVREAVRGISCVKFAIFAADLHIIGGSVVAVCDDVVEHPHRAIRQGNIEHLKIALEWFGDALLCM